MSAAPDVATKPFTIALVDDYDVVLLGLAHMLDDFRDRLVVAEIDANAPLDEPIDVVLYDAFAQPESGHAQIGELVIVRDLVRRQVAVVIVDRFVLGVLVVQLARLLGGEKKIFVDERTR